MTDRTDSEVFEVEHDDLPDLLLRGADIIDQRGWHRGDFFDYRAYFDGKRPIEECGVCVRGALNVAAGGDPTGPGIAREDAREDAVDALAVFLGCDLDEETSPAEYVAYWNDVEAESAEQVTTALRECAAELKAGA